jgi:cytochrome P450
MGYVNRAASLVFSRQDPIEEASELRHGLTAFMDSFIMPAIRRRRSVDRDSSALGSDLIGSLVQAYDPATSMWDGELIAREAWNYMAAGVKSTVNTTMDALVHLLEWAESDPDAVRLAVDPSSDFLNRVVAESLRLHVPNPAITRRAIRPGHTALGRSFDEGQEFVLYIPIAHLDEAIFGPDPERFNPYRVTLDGSPLWGLAFGHGHHACIGRGLALGRFDVRGDFRGYEGVTVDVLRSLLKLGVQYPEGKRPTYRQDTYMKRLFESFPIRLGHPISS